MRDLYVRLPRTATRKNAPSFALLLERVEPKASSPVDFYGRHLKPGQTIEEHELWPTENYPAIPVLLETCQIVFTGRGHNRNPYERVLWIYQVRKREWRQVAHVSAHRPEEWIPVLLPVLLRLVKPAITPPEPDLHSAARRIAAVVEGELLGVPDNTRRIHLLQHAYDYLSQRSTDLRSSPKLYQIPLRPADPDDFFEGLLKPTAPDEIGWTVRDAEAANYLGSRWT